MTRMNPLSNRYLAVESLIFSRSTIEFYRNRGTLPHELPPITFLWVQQPLLCELVTPRGVSQQRDNNENSRTYGYALRAAPADYFFTAQLPSLSFHFALRSPYIFLFLSPSLLLSENLHPRKQQIVGWTSLAIFYPIFVEN